MPGEPSYMVLAAHPDDETIGAGGLLGRLRPEAVIHVTDGAPRDLAWAPAANGDGPGYARARRRELEAAMALAGVPAERLVSLGIVDQEAVLGMPEIAERLAELFSDLAPDRVLTLSYEGGHPDHDATAFAAHAAAELLRRRGRGAPELWEMALYHAGEGRMVIGEFLPGSPRSRKDLRGSTPLLSSPHPRPSPAQGGGTHGGPFFSVDKDPPAKGSSPLGGVVGGDGGRTGGGCTSEEEVVLPLSPAEAERKRRMIAAFATQQKTLRPFLSLPPERFRPAPAYRFAEPPHPGPLQYEVWGFPMDGGTWRGHARQALRVLGLPEGSAF
jgi:LmbE family N-acetylglucosaminyl deacetylase